MLVPEKYCLICNNLFYVNLSRNDTAKYCSRKCLNKSKTLLIGPKNHFYGRKHSKEAIEINRRKALGRCQDPTYRKMLSDNGKKTMSRAGQASKMGKTTHVKHPRQASEMGKLSQIKNPLLREKLVNWNKAHPENYSRGGVAVHRKNPSHAKQIAKRGHELFKKRDKNAYLERQRKGGKGGIKAVLKWKSEDPARAREQSKLVIKQTLLRYPDLTKKAGALSVEKQSRRGFISEPERNVKNFLPEDFIHGRMLGYYVPDFRSEKRKLIIEVDGVYWHGEKRLHQIKHDIEKNNYYSNLGYKVIRLPIPQKPDYLIIEKEIEKILLENPLLQ